MGEQAMSEKGWRVITVIIVVLAIAAIIAVNMQTTTLSSMSVSSLEEIAGGARAAYVKVPAGAFIMGSEVGDAHAPDNEKPQHEVNLGAFLIMRTEVTNAQYAQCVQAGACSPPNSADRKWDKPRYAAYPVTGVTWQQANDYARWVGGRLPSEAEWEKACRGTDGRTYPWGVEPSHGIENLANAWDSIVDGHDLAMIDSKMVGSYPNGSSPYGVLDMSGNVWEWTSSLWGEDPEQPDFPYPYKHADGRENQDAPTSVQRVVRGGAYNTGPSYVRCAARRELSPNSQYWDVGFRVVMSVQPTATVEVSPSQVVTATFIPSVAILSDDRMTVTSPIEMQLVQVPASEFLMGSDPTKDPLALDNEQAQQPVTTAEFYIGKYEVTNNQYRVFAKAAGHGFPLDWRNGNVPAGKEDHPVVNVSWNDAAAFAEWLHQVTGRDFRLCTEMEWEKACRGVDGLIYPWGDIFDATKANTDETGIFKAATAVGAYSPAGDSPYGAADMAGNVWEWVVDRDPGFGSTISPTESARTSQTGDSRVLRGGSFNNSPKRVRCAGRSSNSPTYSAGYIGFRVCMTSTP